MGGKGAGCQRVAGISHAWKHRIVGSEIVGVALVSPLVGARQGGENSTESLDIDVGDKHETHVVGVEIQSLGKHKRQSIDGGQHESESDSKQDLLGPTRGRMRLLLHELVVTSTEVPVAPEEEGRGVDGVDELEDEGEEIAGIVGGSGDGQAEASSAVSNGGVVESDADRYDPAIFMREGTTLMAMRFFLLASVGG